MGEQEVSWRDLKKDALYDIRRPGEEKGVTATFVKVQKETPLLVDLLFKMDSGPFRITVNPKGTDPFFKFYPNIGMNLALVNTKLKADRGVLATILKFHNPNFKPGPWKKGGRRRSVKRHTRSSTSRRKTRR